jgi:hypothetical protein
MLQNDTSGPLAGLFKTKTANEANRHANVYTALVSTMRDHGVGFLGGNVDGLDSWGLPRNKQTFPLWHDVTFADDLYQLDASKFAREMARQGDGQSFCVGITLQCANSNTRTPYYLGKGERVVHTANENYLSGATKQSTGMGSKLMHYITDIKSKKPPSLKEKHGAMEELAEALESVTIHKVDTTNKRAIHNNYFCFNSRQCPKSQMELLPPVPQWASALNADAKLHAQVVVVLFDVRMCDSNRWSVSKRSTADWRPMFGHFANFADSEQILRSMRDFIDSSKSLAPLNGYPYELVKRTAAIQVGEAMNLYLSSGSMYSSMRQKKLNPGGNN